MFSRILVPMDLSPRNTRSLTAAIELARLSGARVTLLHVVQRIDDFPARELRSFYRKLETAAEEKIARAAQRFGANGVEVEGVVLIGVPAREIVRYAAGRKVDLIVMSSHRVAPGRSGEGWGTTSYKVALLCSCPILLVK
jgi:nucleotide-binding universal stress UspA family protein